MASLQFSIGAALVFLAGFGSATLNDHCTDISYFDVVKYTTSPRRCCETSLKQECIPKTDTVCRDVLNLQCEVTAGVDCKFKTSSKQGKKCSVEYKDYELKDCKEVKTSTTHTKQVPDCKKITKNNCVVLYNRVPKCGSSTLKSVLNPLSEKNGFTAIDSPPNKPYFGTELMNLGENELKKKIQIFGNNTLFTEHTHFVNLDSPAVAYINLIRDPIKRVNSAYCYARDLTKHFGNNTYNKIKKQKANETLAEKWLTTPLGQCIQESSIQDCVNDYNLFITIKYFCGSHPSCRYPNTDAAFNRAIAIIDQFYSVVGVLEQMKKSLVVMENELPEYFAGAVQRYEEKEDNVKNKCMADLPPVQNPGDPAYRMLKNHLKREYHLYNHVVSKLEQQYNKIKGH